MSNLMFSFQLTEQFPGCIPETHRSVTAGGCHHLPIMAEARRLDGAEMPFQPELDRSRFSIPDARDGVFAGAQKTPSVG